MRGGSGRRRDGRRDGIGLGDLVGVPAARGGVGRVVLFLGRVVYKLVHMPDANVVRERPHLRRRGLARRRADGVPMHRDLGRVGERGDGDPDQRLAGRVPGVDVAGNRVVARVREPDAAASGAVHIGEAGRRVLREPHKHGEVRKRRGGRLQERKFARELRERGRGKEKRSEKRKRNFQLSTFTFPLIIAPPGKPTILCNYHSHISFRH